MNAHATPELERRMVSSRYYIQSRTFPPHFSRRLLCILMRLCLKVSFGGLVNWMSCSVIWMLHKFDFLSAECCWNESVGLVVVKRPRPVVFVYGDSSYVWSMFVFFNVRIISWSILFKCYTILILFVLVMGVICLW